MKKIYLLGFVLMVSLAMTMSAMAVEKQSNGNPNRGILSPDSKLDGLTYGEWSAKWWQWALPPVEEKNPVSDTTGKSCGVGQSGKVWFLAGTWAGMGDVRRECVIPAEKYIFFPIVNTLWIATETWETVKDGRTANKAIIDNTTLLDVKVDGVSLQKLRKFRAVSPAFDIDLYMGSPIEEILGVPVYFGVSDGYWMMLEPLSSGEHTISIHGKTDVNEVNVTYHLVVASRNKHKDNENQ